MFDKWSNMIFEARKEKTNTTGVCRMLPDTKRVHLNSVYSKKSGPTKWLQLIWASMCECVCRYHTKAVYKLDMFVYSCELCLIRVCDLEHSAPQWPNLEQWSSHPTPHLFTSWASASRWTAHFHGGANPCASVIISTVYRLISYDWCSVNTNST